MSNERIQRPIQERYARIAFAAVSLAILLVPWYVVWEHRDAINEALVSTYSPPELLLILAGVCLTAVLVLAGWERYTEVLLSRE
jgi:hypothetical protein